jgi:hypothetical protein
VIGIRKGLDWDIGMMISPISSSIIALYALMASLPIRNPAGHCSTIWNSTHRHGSFRLSFHCRHIGEIHRQNHISQDSHFIVTDSMEGRIERRRLERIILRDGLGFVG